MGPLERLAWKALLIVAAVAAGATVELFVATWAPALRLRDGAVRNLVTLAAASLWFLASAYRRDLLVWRLGWSVRTIKSTFARLWNPLMWRGLTRDRVPTRLRGFRVYQVVLDKEWDQEAALARLAEELDIVRRLAPSRFERLRRIDPHFAIMPMGGGGYIAWANALVVDPELLTAFPPGYAATVLMHESNHARLHELGVPVGHPWVLDRAERLAILDQWHLVFGLIRAGGYEDAVRQFFAWHEQISNNPWWSGAGEQEQRRIRLERAGMPPWLWWLFGVRRREATLEPQASTGD